MSFARRNRPGLLGTVAQTTVISGTAQMMPAAADRRTTRHQGTRGQDIHSGPPVADPDKLVDSLDRLAALKAQGLLTEEELNTAKSRLLA